MSTSNTGTTILQEFRREGNAERTEDMDRYLNLSRVRLIMSDREHIDRGWGSEEDISDKRVRDVDAFKSGEDEDFAIERRGDRVFLKKRRR